MGAILTQVSNNREIVHFLSEMFKIILNEPRSLFKALSNSFHTKIYQSAYSHRNLKMYSVSSIRFRKLIEAFQTKQTRIPANKPKQRASQNKTTRETSQKRILASKPKNALRFIETILKTDRNTLNEAIARETVNEQKQHVLRNNT